MRAGGCTAARPSELVTSSLSFLVAHASQRLARASQGPKKVTKWPFCLPFWVFSAFSSKASKNLTDCVTTVVKQLNLAGKNQNFSKWSSPEETRVWQLPRLNLGMEKLIEGKPCISLISPKAKLGNRETHQGRTLGLTSFRPGTHSSWILARLTKGRP